MMLLREVRLKHTALDAFVQVLSARSSPTPGGVLFEKQAYFLKSNVSVRARVRAAVRSPYRSARNRVFVGNVKFF